MSEKHGARVGGVYPKTYIIWMGMRARCNNPRGKGYERYGGRGISVCPEWDDYAVFLADMGEAPPGLSIERNDNNKGYSKDNCRWATRFEQNRNLRRSRLITFHGETLCVADWERRLELGKGTLNSRLTFGWDVERAFSTHNKRRARALALRATEQQQRGKP